MPKIDIETAASTNSDIDSMQKDGNLPSFIKLEQQAEPEMVAQVPPSKGEPFSIKKNTESKDKTQTQDLNRKRKRQSPKKYN